MQIMEEGHGRALPFRPGAVEVDQPEVVKTRSRGSTPRSSRDTLRVAKEEPSSSGSKSASFGNKASSTSDQGSDDPSSSESDGGGVLLFKGRTPITVTPRTKKIKTVSFDDVLVDVSTKEQCGRINDISRPRRGKHARFGLSDEERLAFGLGQLSLSDTFPPVEHGRDSVEERELRSQVDSPPPPARETSDSSPTVCITPEGADDKALDGGGSGTLSREPTVGGGASQYEHSIRTHLNAGCLACGLPAVDKADREGHKHVRCVARHFVRGTNPSNAEAMFPLFQARDRCIRSCYQEPTQQTYLFSTGRGVRGRRVGSHGISD